MKAPAIALLALGLAVAGGAGASTTGARFDGYTPRFNLGQAADGAVCEARRGFDGPVADKGGRTWNVTCRGWSKTLGQLYLFPGGARQDAAWRAELAARTTCAPDALTRGAGETAHADCKTRAGGLAYVAFRAPGRRGVVAAEGRAPIADVLARAVRYLAGDVPEPPALDKATTAVSLVSQAPVGELAAADVAQAPSAEARLAEAYDQGQSWQFDEAELEFGELARMSGQDASPTARAEALYNQGLNASNNWRFDKAAIFFAQADALAASADPSVRGLGLNFRAADARNQRDYEGAVVLADRAIAARAGETASGGSLNADGGVVIPEVAATAGTAAISRADRERLRDVQALQIKATALEALGRGDDARAALVAARALLDIRLPVTGTPRRPVFLGQAAPWLNARVWADLLRLDRGTPRQADTDAYFRAAVAYFGQRHPGSLPLAAFFLEQATAEAAEGAKDPRAEAQANADFQAAFAIYIDQRGSLADSADLARPYFDFLLRRIADAPAARDQAVKNFFNAAQALIAQSSAEAAKRQAASALAGDGPAAALARALQDTDHREQANLSSIRRLQEQGVYQGPDLQRLQAEQLDLARQNATLQGELLEADPRYVSALHRLVSVDTLQKALRPDEVYVKVFLLAGGGYGVLVSPTQAIPYRIDLTRARAEDIVRTLRLPMDAPGRTKTGRAIHGAYNVALAHTLFTDLFGPVGAQVLAARHIIFEPDATLVAAPISALVIDDASVRLIRAKAASPKVLDYLGVAWLGAHSYNSIALSASAFYQARLAGSSKAANAFYGFADPVIPVDPDDFSSVRPVGNSTPDDEALCARYRFSLTMMHALPDTRTEVATVAEAVGAAAPGIVGHAFGEDFTDTGVVSQTDLDKYRVLYFATHGLLDDGNPCLRTSLLTSFGGPGSDALLDLEKISRLRLDADVVVLSACNTGSNAHGGGEVASGEAPARASKLAAPKLGNGGGEALGGLVTAFVQAGARNVVVSGWEVDSATTARLMIAMFNQRRISQAGALAEAERTLMNDPRHSHPYYWAPFMVVGDGDRPMPGGSPTTGSLSGE